MERSSHHVRLSAAVRRSVFGGRQRDFIPTAPNSLISTSSNGSFVNSTKFLERGRDGSRPEHRDELYGGTADVRFFDTGHFALEMHCDEIASAIRAFLVP